MRVFCVRKKLSNLETAILPIRGTQQARAEGNCGRVTDRGEEACECAVKLTPCQRTSVRLANDRRQPHSQRNCEVTNRNHIQGRIEQASVPCNAKPFSFTRSGKCGTCAVKLQSLIQGDLPNVSQRKLACSESHSSQDVSCLAEVSRRRSTEPQTPLRTGRPER